MKIFSSEMKVECTTVKLQMPGIQWSGTNRNLEVIWPPRQLELLCTASQSLTLLLLKLTSCRPGEVGWSTAAGLLPSWSCSAAPLQPGSTPSALPQGFPKSATGQLQQQRMWGRAAGVLPSWSHSAAQVRGSCPTASPSLPLLKLTSSGLGEAVCQSSWGAAGLVLQRCPSPAPGLPHTTLFPARSVTAPLPEYLLIRRHIR